MILFNPFTCRRGSSHVLCEPSQWLRKRSTQCGILGHCAVTMSRIERRRTKTLICIAALLTLFSKPGDKVPPHDKEIARPCLLFRASWRRDKEKEKNVFRNRTFFWTAKPKSQDEIIEGIHQCRALISIASHKAKPIENKANRRPKMPTVPSRLPTPSSGRATPKCAKSKIPRSPSPPKKAKAIASTGLGIKTPNVPTPTPSALRPTIKSAHPNVAPRTATTIINQPEPPFPSPRTHSHYHSAHVGTPAPSPPSTTS